MTITANTTNTTIQKTTQKTSTLKPKLNAILFDFDGTIRDSEKLHFQSWQLVLKDYGVDFTWKDYLQNYMGITMPQATGMLIAQFGLAVSEEKLIADRFHFIHTLEKDHTPELMPYAKEVLDYFYDTGVTLALVTGSPREDVDIFFSKMPIQHYFKVIVTRTDVQHSKPHPESYSQALSLLKLSADHAIAIEDTANGISSAKGAGLKCFAVQAQVTIHDKLTQADKLFLNLKEVKLALVEGFDFSA